MYCPQCNKRQYCGCPLCRHMIDDKIREIWITKKPLEIDDNNDTIACGHCGHNMTIRERFKESLKQIKEKGEKYV